MKIIEFECSECEQKLSAPQEAVVVDCARCNARLRLKEQGGAWKATLAEPSEEKLERVVLSKRVNAMDREWEKKQGELERTDPAPDVGLSRMPAGVPMGIAAALIGLAVLTLGLLVPSGGLFVGIGATFLIIGAAFALWQSRSHRSLVDAEDRYLLEKRETLRKMP